MHSRVLAVRLAGLIPLVTAVGCSGSSSGSGFADGDAGTSSSSSGGSSGSSSGGTSSSSGSSSGGIIGSSGGGDGGGQCPPCDPGNVNLPNSTCDLDCSGTTTPPTSCDANLSAAGPASDFAKAIGICQMAAGNKWGLVSATYTQGFGKGANPAPNPGQHALLPSFGSVIMPREGKTIGVLSSGFANVCDDASPSASCMGSGMGDPYFKGEQVGMTGPGAAPPGYPKPAAGCMVDKSVNDVIGVTLLVRVPNNAQGFSFDFDFYSGEWPEYVCTAYNDGFVAWLQSAAWTGMGGDLNISFDSMMNPVSVNNGFFDRCTPNTVTGSAGTVMKTAPCPGGPSELQGTGFYNLGSYGGAQSTGGGATGWLTSKAPVKGGEVITLQFLIWDTGDQAYDSSVLIDNLSWYGMPVTTGTTRPPAQ